MPRLKSKSKEQIISDAMTVFWQNGFNGTSMDMLVKETGASRHAIYTECGGKEDLFQQSLAIYQRVVVDPAFQRVEEDGADIRSIEDYFDIQISWAERAGSPFPGCLVANTMTETGPHNPDVLLAVNKHNERLRMGFQNALRNSSPDPDNTSESKLGELAAFLTISTQGLWAYSRSVSDTEELRTYVKNLMSIIEERIR